MNKAIVVGALVAFCIPIGFVLFQVGLKDGAAEIGKGREENKAQGRAALFLRTLVTGLQPSIGLGGRQGLSEVEFGFAGSTLRTTE